MTIAKRVVFAIALVGLLSHTALAQQAQAIPVISGKCAIDASTLAFPNGPSLSSVFKHSSYANARVSVTLPDGTISDAVVNSDGSFTAPIDPKYLGQTYELQAFFANGVLRGVTQGIVALNAPAITVTLTLLGKSPSLKASGPLKASDLQDFSDLKKMLDERRTYASRSFDFVTDRTISNDAYDAKPDTVFHFGRFTADVAVQTTIPAKWQKTTDVFMSDPVFIENATDPKQDSDASVGLSAIAAEVHANGPDVLLFVHGFNAPLDGAAAALAQVAFIADWGAKVALVYAWPSQGHPLSYTADSSVATDPEEIAHFSQFLANLVAAAPSIRLHIVAHSMGNRLVLAALLRDPSVDAAVTSVDFFAGDVLPGALAPVVDPLRKARKTMYFNDNDLALHLSTCFNHQQRLGLGENAPPPGVSAFDATPYANAVPSGLGHSYFTNTTTVAAAFNRSINGTATPIANTFSSVPWLADRASPLKLTPLEISLESSAACALASRFI